MHHRFAAAVVLALLLLILGEPSFGQSRQDVGPPDAGPLDFLQSGVGRKHGLDPVAPGDLLGVVTDGEDRGVGGATVYLSTANRWKKGSQKTVTDDRGQFVFRRLEPGEYHLAAVQGDRASRTEYRKWRKVTHAMKLDAEPVVLALREARRVEVLVASGGVPDGPNPDGPKPLAGARVRVRWQDVPDNKPTDRSGRAVFEGLAPQSHLVEVTAPGFAKQTQQVDLKPAIARSLRFELAPGATLRGTLVDESGAPLPGAWISAEGPGRRGNSMNGMKTNGQGEYRLPNTPAGVELKVYASLDGYQPLQTSHPAIAAGQAATTNWTLKRRPYGGAVEGVVLGADGEPIAGAKISNWGRSSDHQRLASTDNNGRFLLSDLYRGIHGYEVIAQAAGHVGKSVKVTPGERDRPAQLTFRLEAGNRLRARVVDEQGAPIVGARVQFGRSHFGIGEQQRTDDQGRFAFDTLPRGAKLDISARNHSGRRGFEPELNSAEPVEIVLAPTGLVRGVVVDDATGEPIQEFHARGTFSPESRPGDPSGTLNNEVYDGQSFASESGEFEFRDLMVGMPLMIVAEAEGYRTASLRRVVVPRPSEAERVELRLKRVDQETVMTVAGKLVDDAGQPVAGARVCLIVTQNEKDKRGWGTAWHAIMDERLEVGGHVLQGRYATTDAEGGFRFAEVYRDAFLEIAYWSSNVAAARRPGLEKLPADKLATLTLTANKPAELRVAVGPGVPDFDSMQLSPSHNEWWRTPNNLRTSRAESGDPDRWVIRGVPPGDYRLILYRYVPVESQPGMSTSENVASKDVSLAAGEVGSVSIDEKDLRSQSRSVFDSIGRALRVFGQAAASASPPAKDKPADKSEQSAE